MQYIDAANEIERAVLERKAMSVVKLDWSIYVRPRLHIHGNDIACQAGLLKRPGKPAVAAAEVEAAIDGRVRLQHAAEAVQDPSAIAVHGFTPLLSHAPIGRRDK